MTKRASRLDPQFRHVGGLRCARLALRLGPGGEECASSLAFGSRSSGVGVAFAKPTLTIEKALADSWGLAGYVRGYDNRSSLMLFRRKDKTCLVQCAALHD